MTEREEVLEAVKNCLEASPERNFTQSVELAINLKDLDLSNPGNRVDEEIALPKGRGKPNTVGVFATAEVAANARNVADVVITPEEIDDLSDDKREARKMADSVDWFLAEAPLMPTIGRTLGTVLGPRGKMPSPIPPGADPSEDINRLRRTVRVKSRDKRTFHTAVGSEDMSPEDLADNVLAVMDRVIRGLERRRMNIHSIYLKTTMGPSIAVPF